MYIMDDIPCIVFLKHPTSKLLLLELRKLNLLCGVFYHPPSSNSTPLVDLESALESLPPSKLRSILLVGDFNIDLKKPSPNPLTPHLQTIQDKLCLKQIVSTSTFTRSSGTLASLIDHVYLSEELPHSTSEVLPSLASSDHNIFSLSFGLLKCNPNYRNCTLGQTLSQQMNHCIVSHLTFSQHQM